MYRIFPILFNTTWCIEDYIWICYKERHQYLLSSPLISLALNSTHEEPIQLYFHDFSYEKVRHLVRDDDHVYLPSSLQTLAEVYKLDNL